ncbi:MAG: methyltransferase [Desulfocapsaceae bacterium]|nr:methyltransferase [Desulfocapsaceae bacterium]
MYDRPLYFLAQEKDLQLFLDSLDLKLPAEDLNLPDGFIVIPLASKAASIFEAADNKAVLLAYRNQGSVFPVSLVFLVGKPQALFCHATLLLDAYAQGNGTVPLLRKAVQEFFAQKADDLLATLEPAWVDADLVGQMDCRILWNLQPDIKIVTDLFLEKRGLVCDIPLFPTVYYYNTPYEQNMLEEVLPKLEGCKDILILGTGAGLEAACVTMQYGTQVDATDINPLAVANTIATCRRAGTDHLVKAWVSDGLKNVTKAYDAIIFEAPLATNQAPTKDLNRFDPGGKLLKEVLSALPSHLQAGGRLYVMSRPDLSPYIPANGLQWQVLRSFEAKTQFAILEVWQG